MSKTVIALYDDFATARATVEDLVVAGFARENISIVAADTSGEYKQYLEDNNMSGDVSGGQGAGFGAVVGALVGLGVALIPGIGPVLAAGPLAAAAMAGVGAVAGAVTGGVVASLVDMGVPEEEAGYFAEGIRRGGTLVSATVDDSSVSRAQDIINRHHPIDLEDRSATWREAGWTDFDSAALPYTSDQVTTRTSAVNTTPTPTEQAHYDVVEEELKVGKRDVESGGVRVRSYVTSTPVEEQVNLRDEHVRVERRPVNRPASEADITAFREGVIEVTEHHEQAVVAKEARVVEEVVIDKTATQHTETIRDEVRRTDVEVENVPGTTVTSYKSYEPRFRNLWSKRYGTTNYTWDDYAPAYRYGYTLATNDQYRDYDWARVEPEARRYYEGREPGMWERFKDSVHDAWMEVTGRR